MNLLEYARLIFRRGWIIVVLAILAAASAYFLSTFTTPVFRATQRVLMQPTRADLGLTEASKTLLGNQVAYLSSQFRAQEVIDRLNLDMQSAELIGNVTIAPDPLDLTIQIDVDLRGEDINITGRQASDIARTWGELLIQYRVEQNQKARREDHINASLQDNPQLSQTAPRPLLNAAAGGVLGVILGGVIIFVLEFLESNIIRNREDLERTLELPVLANIPAKEG